MSGKKKKDYFDSDVVEAEVEEEEKRPVLSFREEPKKKSVKKGKVKLVTPTYFVVEVDGVNIRVKEVREGLKINDEVEV